MIKTMKISLCVVAFIFSSIVFDCIYGFTIKGEANISYLLLAFFSAIIVSFVLSVIIFKVKNLKTEKFIICFIAIAISFVALSFCLYNPLNTISADRNSVKEYESQIERITAPYAIFIFEPTFEISFKDDNGETVTVTTKSPIIDYEEGDKIDVKETMGGFGNKIYDVNFKTD
jgi:hypothetical protein